MAEALLNAIRAEETAAAAVLEKARADADERIAEAKRQAAALQTARETDARETGRQALEMARQQGEQPRGDILRGYETQAAALQASAQTRLPQAVERIIAAVTAG